MPPLSTPFAGSHFSLNSAGVAGFFGGEEAIPAMATICLFKGGRWLGWYNSPGSYTIAKQFGRMANSRIWAALFPGPRVSPVATFGLDGTQGPPYIGVLSGTRMKTGYLGYLTMEWSKQKKPVRIPGRVTRPNYVSYLALKKGSSPGPIKRLPFKGAPSALIPIMASFTACIMCALVYDWFSFSVIFLGITSSGLASYFIGGRKVTIEWPSGASRVLPSYGILVEEESVVIIKGSERDMDAITRGHFSFEMDSQLQADKEDGYEQGRIAHHSMGFCCLLLVIQFLVQLLLVPQGSLFGQIMFLFSLAISWAHNSNLSSLEKEKIQTRILSQTLGDPDMLRFRVGTRASMVVFVCLLLLHKVKVSMSLDMQRNIYQMILQSLIPNDIVVWRRWREMVVNQLLHLDDTPESLPFLKEDEDGLEHLSKQDRALLRMLLRDAATAIEGYFSVRGQLPDDSSKQRS